MWQKMIKKIISFILCFAVLLMPLIVVNAIEETSYTNQNSHYNRLKSMGIIDFEMSQSDEFVSRAQVAYATAKVLTKNIEDFSLNVFNDVAIGSYASGAIGFMYSKGIMSGDGRGNFRPDDTITYNELMKIFVSITGYSYVAEKQGGYPIGYLNTAASIGISRNVSVGSLDKITNKEFCDLLYRAIETPVMENELNDKNNYFVNNNHTLMGNILQREDLTYSSGILISDGIADIYGKKTVNKSSVLIGDTVIFNNNIDASQYLGLSVEYWYYDQGGHFELASLYPNNINKTVEFNVEDIKTASFSGYEVYDNAYKLQQLRLNTDDFCIVFNGDGVSEFTEDTLFPKNGSVKLIDNNNDNLYDIVFIYEYEIYLIEETGLEGYNLYFKSIGYGTDLGLYVDKDNKDIFYNVYNEQGKKVTPIELSKNQIVQVSKSKNGRIISVNVSKSKVDGKLEGLSHEGGIATINGGEYELVKRFDGSYPEMDIGKNGIFYVDTSGRIVYFEEGISNKDYYGYIEGMVQQQGLSGTVEIKMVKAGSLGTAQGKWYWWVKDKFVQNSEIKIYKFAARTTLDGESVRSPKIDQVSKYLFQVVKYTVDTAGDINSIEIIEPDFIMDESNYNHETQALITTDKNQYDTGNGIEHAVLLVGNIMCLAIPSLKQIQTGEYSDDAFLAKYRIENGQKTEYIRVYDLPQDSQTPRLITMGVNLKQSGDLFAGVENYAIVKRVSMVKSGVEDAYKITYMQGGGEREAIVDVSVNVVGIKNSIDGITAGDVVFLEERYDGTIGGINVIESLKDSRRIGFSEDNDKVYGGVTKIQTSRVWERKNDKLYNFIELDFGDAKGRLVVPSDLIIYKYNKSNNNISICDLNSIKGGVEGIYGDMIFAIISNNAAEFAVVIE